jgi:hypothetical protein
VSPEDVPEGPLCVDTDVFSLIFTRKGRFEEFWPLIQGHVLAVSFSVVGELRAGAIKARWSAKRRERQERVLREHYVVLTPTDRVVHQFHVPRTPCLPAGVPGRVVPARVPRARGGGSLGCDLNQ